MKFRVAVASVAAFVSVAGVVAVADARAPDLLVQSPNDTLTASDVLQSIRVEKENPRGYNRGLFRHWLDVDGDGCDAREQVLKRDAIGLAQVDPFRCAVVEADWISAYDGVKTSDRSTVEIDHVVALKEAWDSGAWGWNEAQRTAFANDTSDSRTLLAVSSSSNRSKSDRDPSNWLPSLRGYVCTYVSNWISIKARWNLSMDQSEWSRLNNLLSGQCAGTTMRGWNAPPVAVPTPSTTVAPSSSGSGSSGSGSSGSGSSGGGSDNSGNSGGTSPTLATIRPGAFCAPEGALGISNGIAYVCSKTDVNGKPYSNDRARWRRST